MRTVEPRRRRRAGVGPRANLSRQPGAWFVHVERGGRIYSRYFSDAVYGGPRKSLVAGQRFRDELLQSIEPDTRVRKRLPRGSRNETGIVGVWLERYLVEGREYERYVALWRDPEGRQRRRRFSVGKFGRRRALALAAEAREEGVARTRAVLLERQREEAARRLAAAPPLPRRVKDLKSRKGIRMPPRRR